MAYIQETEQDQPQQQQPTQAPQTSMGGTAGNTAPQGAGAVPNASKAPPVQDLHAYLEANAPQAVQMGQNIAQNLNETAQGAVGDVNAAKQSFDKTLQDQTIAPNTDLINQAATNPTEFIKDPNNVSAFNAQRDATYNGPATFESTPEYSSAIQSVSNAVQKAPDITKPNGIQQLVRGQEKNPTTGMSNLDYLLLQENPDAVAPIQKAIPQFNNLGDFLSGTASGENSKIQKSIGSAADARKGIQDTFLTGQNAAIPNFQKGVINELNTNRDAYRKSPTPDDIFSNYMESLFPGGNYAAIPGKTSPDLVMNMLDKETLDRAKALEALGFDGGSNVLDPRDFYQPTAPVIPTGSVGSFPVAPAPKDPEEEYFDNLARSQQ